MKSANLEDEIRRILESAGIENCIQEAAWLAKEKNAGELARRRANREPLQYILGTEFFGEFELFVGKGVLIPRPETYAIAETAMAFLPCSGTFCEIGTGSGAIAVAVAAKRPDIKAYASDISGITLEYAEKNRAKYSLDNLILKKGPLFEPHKGMKFNFIAANLPYIPYSEKQNLQPEVRDFEPETALFADGSGTALIKKSFENLADFMLPDAKAMFEASPEQMSELSAYAAKCGFKNHIMRDCFGKDRFIILDR